MSPQSSSDAPSTVMLSGLGVCASGAQCVDDFVTQLELGHRSALRRPLPGAGNPVVYALPEDLELERRLDAYVAGSGQSAPELTHLVRRATPGVKATLLACVEAWAAAGWLAMPPSPRAGILLAGNNLNAALAFRSHGDYLREDFVSPTYAVTGLDTYAIGIVAAALDIRGEGVQIGASSASGTAALVQGMRAVRHGYCDPCLVVGAPTLLSPAELMAFANLGALGGFDGDEPPDTVCRPFDTARCGFVPGEGAAAVVLESAESVRRRGRSARIELRGGAIVLDGGTGADPTVDGESRVMLAALRDAGVAPGQVDYVNTHGTGSSVGDEVEVKALEATFGGALRSVRLNATKALTGHCLSAAGLIEAVATALQLEGGFLHANPNLSAPIAEHLGFVGAAPETVRCACALSTSYAFGGINTAVVLTDRGQTT